MIRRPKTGFTVLELMIVMGIMAVIATVALPRVVSTIRHNQVNRAARLVAGDLQTAFTLAGRQRQPIRISVNTSTLTYTIADRTTGSTLRSRVLGSTSAYRLSALTFSPSSVDVFPSGISTAALTVTVTSGDYSRTVTASSAGFVRSVQ